VVEVAPAGPAAAPPHPATVLCIDDDRLVLGVCTSALEARGHRVVMATHGQAGLAAAAQERPDLILLDILMPGMDGLEVCRRLRADPEHRDTPIILLTASTDASLAEQGAAAGATLVMRKPFGTDAIVETTERLLARKRRPRIP
jgi:CheY-like chemotaxis protein